MTTQAQADPERERGDDPMVGRRAWIRVDHAKIMDDEQYEGRYQVQITGHNLKMAISPPRIEVGGVPLENISFEGEGKIITGTLVRQPEDNRVVVDYGFARHAGVLSREGR